jgi:signal transduction histidine kinase
VVEEGEIIASASEKSAVPAAVADFGEFVLINQEEITRRWVTVVDRSPEVAASEDLTYRQLLDHLPELCRELAATLKKPGERSVRDRMTRDASAHGRKRWQQGYRLHELIRELCLIRRNFLDIWPKAFGAQNQAFDREHAQSVSRTVERFFDDIIIDSTIQFVDDQTEAVRQIKGAALADAKSSLLRHVSHTLREPLAAIVLAAEALGSEQDHSREAHENIKIILRNAQIQADNVDELVLAAELFSGGMPR